jgi:hypothetical protein
MVELPHLDVGPVLAQQGVAQGALPLRAAHCSPPLEADALQEVPCLQVYQEPECRFVAERQGVLPCPHLGPQPRSHLQGAFRANVLVVLHCPREPPVLIPAQRWR